MSLSILKIASRESKLALWQTNVVAETLTSLGFRVELVPLKTSGDVDLVSPIYAMGVTGVFTRELDIALLNHHADLAVHSLKDVPTILPPGLIIAAVLARGSSVDVLIHRPEFAPGKQHDAVIATSSIRRKSQWLERYPSHTMVNVRGNVETRLQKFKNEGWDGIVFAKAGLERLGLLPENSTALAWMIPAPAQGAICVICRENDLPIFEACRSLNHAESERRVTMERDFLHYLEGGCSVPISAVAYLSENHWYFTGAVHSLDGRHKVKTELIIPEDQWQHAGQRASANIKASARGAAILREFRTLNRHDENEK